MATKRVYDLPTRVFHWLFAASFVVAFTIGKTIDDDSTVFSFHMIAGLLLCFLILWRILWGTVGSRHARFSDLQLNPAALVAYVKDVFSSSGRLWSGHNPASSWAMVLMLSIGLTMGITGFLMTTGQGGEAAEEVHELLANAFIVVVILHIAGVLIHTIKHKDPIGKSMITGCKQNVADEEAPVPAHIKTGVVLLLLTFGLAGYLVSNFDPATRNLSIMGKQFHLAEFEDGDEHVHHEYEHEYEHDEDD
ncbi:cytochrome b/b6 domain-containing protein [Teredinibacter sp. KSP-S5-2]|uniref:cytochrome b/b6 domain-containing protein n=1 Tax=Teredinibacter sp. KSP-S5-2 TaxID=3034506 RepID=UPI0029350136|nr:cytochrome b/b6 domain-containing protein [Teredinibacter sp. KSP-S5-2]WNO11441.1 cytochrome b/b6 domain-containing protein [Teredinibacter sp. KSP-S5-2]